METCSCSLPTSMAAALGLMIDRVFMGTPGLGLINEAPGARSSPIIGTNLPNGNTACAASPNNTPAEDQNQSLLRATFRARQRVKTATLRRTLRTPVTLSGSWAQCA